jgi:hypothetical protein
MQKEFESVEAADDYLRGLVRKAKKESEKQFDRNDPRCRPYAEAL